MHLQEMRDKDGPTAKTGIAEMEIENGICNVTGCEAGTILTRGACELA
jgi:hypothetical protein